MNPVGYETRIGIGEERNSWKNFCFVSEHGSRLTRLGGFHRCKIKHVFDFATPRKQQGEPPTTVPRAGDSPV